MGEQRRVARQPRRIPLFPRQTVDLGQEIYGRSPFGQEIYEIGQRSSVGCEYGSVGVARQHDDESGQTRVPLGTTKFSGT